jgi:hypothetical protein
MSSYLNGNFKFLYVIIHVTFYSTLVIKLFHLKRHFTLTISFPLQTTFHGEVRGEGEKENKSPPPEPLTKEQLEEAEQRDPKKQKGGEGSATAMVYTEEEMKASKTASKKSETPKQKPKQEKETPKQKKKKVKKPIEEETPGRKDKGTGKGKSTAAFKAQEGGEQQETPEEKVSWGVMSSRTTYMSSSTTCMSSYMTYVSS